MKLLKSFFPIAIGLAALIPSVASADIYDWTFGGGTDSVSGSGTLTTVATAYANIYLITGGSGTVTDSAGTFNVSILPLNGAPAGLNGNFSPCGNISTPLDCATLQNPPGSGGANYGYDNLLYYPAPGASQLDANGIILYNQAGPQSQSFFDVWSAASKGNPLPDNFYNSVTGANTNFSNQFTVTEAGGSQGLSTTPEPGYGFLALGLLGMIVGVRRWKSRLV
jgi:hypothetical protein